MIQGLDILDPLLQAAGCLAALALSVWLLRHPESGQHLPGKSVTGQTVRLTAILMFAAGLVGILTAGARYVIR